VDRRKLYRIVAELLPRVGGAEALLDSVADAMRMKGEVPGFLGDLQSLLNQDDALGRIYQAINAPALEAAYRGTARTGRKFTSGEIPAVTQLFTPRWVVEFLLQNSLGRIWVRMHSDTRLRKTWTWFVDSPAEPMPMRRAREIRVCDPACGTMNFGLVALEMLREMYLEEMDRSGADGWPDSPSCDSVAEIGASVVACNLVGFDIDPTAIRLAIKTLEIKIGCAIVEGRHGLAVRDALFGERVRGEFDVVVTNPPYLSSRNLEPAVVRRLKARYPAGWRDLYACFMLRSMEMLRPGGVLGILSMHSFMFTAAFEKMRRELMESAEIRAVAHFGLGLFDIGNPGTLQTAAVVMELGTAEKKMGVFFRLVDVEDKCAALAGAISGESSLRFEMTGEELGSMPRAAWMYWISAASRRVFREFPKLGEISPPRQGLATTDNMRFVRYWWEVEPPNFSGSRDKWMPYAKGGRFRRWYELPRHRVNWEDDGRKIKAAIVERYPYLDGEWKWVAKNSAWYGRAGITYSYLTSGTFSARRLEPGTIFDVAGSSLFPDDPLALLGVLNSSVAGELLSAINPTVNFQVGDLRQLPVPRSFPQELRDEVGRAIEATHQLDCFDETSLDFVQPEGWGGRPAYVEMIDNAQERVDAIVTELYGVGSGRHPDESGPCSGTKEELARKWISYALGVWFGRWGGAALGEVAVLSPLDAGLRRDLRRILADCAGEFAALEIEAAVGGLDRFLGGEFLAWHGRQYRGRPVYWGFRGETKMVCVYSLAVDSRIIRSAFGLIGEAIPDGWSRWPDDGTVINLAPLAAWIGDRKLRKYLTELARELEQGRYGFSETSRWMAGRVSRGLSVECVPVRRRGDRSLGRRPHPAGL
jgi:N-6 DNA Methylase